jgi:hypothetical protein
LLKALLSKEGVSFADGRFSEFYAVLCRNMQKQLPSTLAAERGGG